MIPMVTIETGTAVLFGMCMAILSLVLLVAFLADQVIRQNGALAEDDEADHAACTAHIADVTSRRFVAVALRDLAERYDSVPEQRVLTSLRRRWLESGPSVPALWLLHHADLLDPQDES